MKKLLCLFFLIFKVSSCFAEVTVSTVWGPHKINHPLIEKLISNPILERMKHIEQFGPAVYFGSAKAFTRFDHCVGVLVLLNKAQVPLKEQVAGLLHDVSHTAFSHVADTLFYTSNGDKSYQDIIHLEFLKDRDVEKMTAEYGIKISDLNPDLPDYVALERHLPDLCADRIQYILHEGVITNSLSADQAKDIVNDLHFSNGKWYFTQSETAKIFARLSLKFTKNNWGSPENFLIYEKFAALLRYAMHSGLITKKDIQSGTDRALLDLLKSSKDRVIQKHLKELKTIKNSFEVIPFDQGELKTKPKFRGVDPLILSNGKLVRLTKIDANYKEDFEKTKKWCLEGYAIKVTSNENS